MPVTPTRLVGDLAQTSVGATASQTQVIGLMEWSIDWKRKKVEATTTDDTQITNLPSLPEWSAKAKYAYIDGDISQENNIFASLVATQAPVEWNFFPTVGVGRDSWKGLAFIESATVTAGIGKVVAIDISLACAGPLTRVAQLAPTGTEAED